jgi:hypothetical protein
MSAKTLQSSRTKNTQTKDLIPEKYQDLFFIGVIILSVFIFLAPAIFGGGSFNSSDNIASQSFRTYLDDAKRTGDFPLWLPHIFGGMPSYAALLTTGERSWDFITQAVFAIPKLFISIFDSNASFVAFWYMLYGAGMYLLMRTKVNNRYISFFTAFAAVFSTWIITWVMIGHNTKPIAISMFPWILMCLEKLRERFSLLYAVLLVVAVHILAESTHVQMIFYGICTFGLYLLFELIARLISRDRPLGVLRAALMLALAGGLALAMSADRYMSTMEYTKYSTRATAPIQQLGGKSQDESGGFDYEYATNWSFSPAEVMTFLVPNFYGYGKLERKDGPEQGQHIQTYFGQMPFTDAPNYMGIFVLVLAVIGAVGLRKDHFVQFLIALSIFSLFLSFGKNLPILYDLFFYFVPSFNKFRAPSMALAMMQFAVPILAGYGLVQVTQWRAHPTLPYRKRLMWGVGAAVLFVITGFIISSMFETSYTEAVMNGFKSKFGSVTEQQFEQWKQGAGYDLSQFVFKEMLSDWYATAFIALAAAVAGFFFVQNKINRMVFFSILSLLLVIDLWRVAYRGMEVSETNWDEEVFQRTDLVDFLQQDNSLYRIADLNGFPSPNVPAYFRLQNVHGYHSAKLRVYQDLLDVAGNGGGSVIANPFLWNLMNVKYIVAGQELQGVQPVFQSQQMRALVYQNPAALPRAFFVNRWEKAEQMDILTHLKDGDFEPRDVAFVEKDLPRVDPANGATANISSFKNEYLKLDVNATGNNLLFLSEVYYPASWHAYIDGKETEIFKTNFAFRSIVVPPGKHTVEFKFISPNFQTGKTISLITNIAVLLAGGLAIFLERRKKKLPPPSETPVPPAPTV